MRLTPTQPRKKPQTRDVVTYNGAISACAKAGRKILALKLLIVMEEEHIRPNVISYSSATWVSIDDGRWRAPIPKAQRATPVQVILGLDLFEALRGKMRQANFWCFPGRKSRFKLQFKWIWFDLAYLQRVLGAAKNHQGHQCMWTRWSLGRSATATFIHVISTSEPQCCELQQLH